jgi:hypothetical protein
MYKWHSVTDIVMTSTLIIFKYTVYIALLNSYCTILSTLKWYCTVLCVVQYSALDTVQLCQIIGHYDRLFVHIHIHYYCSIYVCVNKMKKERQEFCLTLYFFNDRIRTDALVGSSCTGTCFPL